MSEPFFTPEEREKFRLQCRQDELKNIELPWLEKQAAKGRKIVHGIDIQKRLAEVRKVLEE